MPGQGNKNTVQTGSAFGVAGLCPTCTYKKMGQGKGNVQAYSIVTMCASCQAAQTTAQSANQSQQEQMQIGQLIAQEQYDLAKASLISKGVLAETNGVLSII